VAGAIHRHHGKDAPGLELRAPCRGTRGSAPSGTRFDGAPATAPFRRVTGRLRWSVLVCAGVAFGLVAYRDGQTTFAITPTRHGGVSSTTGQKTMTSRRPRGRKTPCWSHLLRRYRPQPQHPHRPADGRVRGHPDPVRRASARSDTGANLGALLQGRHSHPRDPRPSGADYRGSWRQVDVIGPGQSPWWGGVTTPCDGRP
jgi:hypothetical protein